MTVERDQEDLEKLIRLQIRLNDKQEELSNALNVTRGKISFLCKQLTIEQVQQVESIVFDI